MRKQPHSGRGSEMTYDEMIDILQAAKAGKVIEYRDHHAGWSKWTRNGFDFLSYQYRVKPEPKRCWVKWCENEICYTSHTYQKGWTEMIEVVR